MLEWNPSLETGEHAIDEQHRELIRLFDQLVTAESDDPAAVPAVLEHLTAYVASHFAMEEDLMNREGLPETTAEAHKAEHRELTEQTRAHVLQYRRGELASVLPLVEFLRGWLQNHVRKTDIVLAAHVRGGRTHDT